jgi:hypothetical protein
MDGSVGFVVDWWVVFGMVVCPIVTALIPVVAELLLRFSAAEPPQAEVHGFGFLRDNGEVGDANGSGVIHLDWRAWLGPTHFDEGLMEGGHFLGGGVESTEFSFGGRRHDKLHYLGD